MPKSKVKSRLRGEKLKESKSTFQSQDYQEYNNGYHWQFDLGDVVFNFYPSTHKWNTSYKPEQKMLKGQGIESFCKAIGYIK